MIRFDATVWVMGTLGLTAVEPDPSLLGFVKNASVIGSIVGAGWLVEARIGRKIGTAIDSHTRVEEERLRTVKAEFTGEVGKLATRIEAIHDKLDSRPCASRCAHTPAPRGEG